MNQPQKPHNLAHMNWFLPVFICLTGLWPIGVLLGIAKIVDMKREREDDLARRQWLNTLGGTPTYSATDAPRPGEYGYRAAPGNASGKVYGPGFSAGPAAAAKANAAAGSAPADRLDHPTDEQKRSAKLQKLIPLLLTIAGILLGINGISTFTEGMSFIMWLGFDMWTLTNELLPGLLSIVGGGGMLFFGSRMRHAARMEKLLDNIVGERDSVTVAELRAASGMNENSTLQTLKDAIRHGLFGADAYIDMGTKTLVVRGAAPAAPAKKAEPAKKAKAKAEPKPEEDKYQAILRQLHEVNEAIPGEEMTAKINRLESISARIFELAKKDPDKLPQLNRFMDYYLPTALKLLNTYAQLDKQGVDGQNITETKASIEKAMDLLVTAFENQLDKLFQSAALDVSSDIAALSGMLNMDGLTGNSDFSAFPAAPQPPKPKL